MSWWRCSDVLEFERENQRKRQPRNTRLGSQTILEAARVCPLRATLRVKGKAFPHASNPTKQTAASLAWGPRASLT